MHFSGAIRDLLSPSVIEWVHLHILLLSALYKVHLSLENIFRQVRVNFELVNITFVVPSLWRIAAFLCFARMSYFYETNISIRC